MEKRPWYLDENGQLSVGFWTVVLAAFALGGLTSAIARLLWF